MNIKIDDYFLNFMSHYRSNEGPMVNHQINKPPRNTHMQHSVKRPNLFFIELFFSFLLFYKALSGREEPSPGKGCHHLIMMSGITKARFPG